MRQDKNRVLEMLRESNAIEGVYDDKSLDDAYKAWQYVMKKEKCTLGMINGAHKIMMAHQDIPDMYKGVLRDVPVFIGGRQAPPDNDYIGQEQYKLKDASRSEVIYDYLRNAMLDWIKKVNDGMDAFMAHVDFEHIHPYVDGNGRLGRMIMNWQLEKQGEGMFTFYAEDRHTYYKLFEQYGTAKLDEKDVYNIINECEQNYYDSGKGAMAA